MWKKRKDKIGEEEVKFRYYKAIKHSERNIGSIQISEVEPAI